MLIAQAHPALGCPVVQAPVREEQTVKINEWLVSVVVGHELALQVTNMEQSIANTGQLLLKDLLQLGNPACVLAE